MEHFTEEETERLNKILAVDVNPYLRGDGGCFKLPLGGATRKWLFETHVNLPADAKEEVSHLLSDDLPDSDRIDIVNEILERRQINSAPRWWELEFFEFDRRAMWGFVVEQCRRNYSEGILRDEFDHLILSINELNQARHIIYVSKFNSDRYSEEQRAQAIETYDRSYPLDFRDYHEAPKEVRSPLDLLQEFIMPELSDVGTVLTKRWFEFKILDELASWESHVHEGERDSELSKKMAAQIRSYMQERLLALGRLVEHYRWKFSYETAALRGLRSTKSDIDRGRRGGEASERAKKENVEAFLAEIEALSNLFPRITEKAIFEQAYQNAAAKRKMPKSVKTVEGYGIAIRSEPPYKARYDAIFRKNA